MTATPAQATAIQQSLIEFLGSGDERKTLKGSFGSYPLLVTEDAFGDVRLMLSIDDMNIHDLDKSVCGRFKVDPLEAYGLTPQQVSCFKQLEKIMDNAVQDGLNAFCLTIQDSLGIDAGDYAGIYFSGGAELNKLRTIVGKYMLAELQQED